MILFVDLRTGIVSEPSMGDIGSVMSKEMFGPAAVVPQTLAIELNVEMLAKRAEELKRPGGVF